MEAERREVVVEAVSAGDDAGSLEPAESQPEREPADGRQVQRRVSQREHGGHRAAVPATIFHRERGERFAGLVSSNMDERRSFAL